MKQKLLLLLCALMATVTANAYDFSYEHNGKTIYFNKTSDNTCEVTSGSYEGEILIPSEVTYNGTTYTVTSIGEAAFNNRFNLTSVEIPNSVTSIGDSAFDKCFSLTSVEIPNSVTSIGEFAFMSCISLTSIEIPNSVTLIGKYAFYRCTSLTTIEIPNSVTFIGQEAFAYCSSLTSIDISNSVTDIGSSAFSYCSSLTSIKIPNSVTSIGMGTFESCSSLTSIDIPESVTSIGVRAFYKCTSLTSVEIPNSVTSIGGRAFQNCSSLTSIKIPDSVSSIGANAFTFAGLTSVEIPNSVTEIGEAAFYDCGILKSIKVDNDNPSSINLGNNVFGYVHKSACILYVPKGSKELYSVAEQWKEFENIVEFFNGVSLIDGEVYDSAEDMEGVDVTYTRRFNNINWQPLYVPFNMSYEEWSEYAIVAELNDVHQFDGNDDGDFDDPEDATVVEFRILKSGEINPNIPYLIKAKTFGEVCFEGHDKTVLAAPEQPGNVWCTNTHYKYTYTGNYVPVTNLYELGAYAMSKGNFYTIPEGDTRALNPNRAYLTIDPINVGYGQNAAKPSKVRVSVDGEMTDGIDGIVFDSINDSEMYDLTGRKVANPRPGIYIQNGKKVIIK